MVGDSWILLKAILRLETQRHKGHRERISRLCALCDFVFQKRIMRRYRDRACGTGSLLQCDAVRSAQIAWCQANRLRVVEEKSKGVTVVHLDRARTPAPSWSALGWLETSRIWCDENAWRSMKSEVCSASSHETFSTGYIEPSLLRITRF